MAAIFVAGAYLLGAVPFGLLIGLARGVDVRTQGSRNIGATNVGRVLGRQWGFFCLALDILKGFGPTLCASFLLPGGPSDLPRQIILLLIALAAVLGHVFPIYLRFRGGKGVATTVGVALGIWPAFTISMVVALLIYALARFTTGLVSVGSLAIAVAFPATFFAYVQLTGLPLRTCWPLQTAAILLGLLIILRHRENIQRLLLRQEMPLDDKPHGD